MTERIKAILDRVTEKVLAYRPVDKGLAAKKTARRLRRQARKESQSDAAKARREALMPDLDACLRTFSRPPVTPPRREDMTMLEELAEGLTKEEADALRTFSPFSDRVARRLVGLGLLTGGDGCYFRTPFAKEVRAAWSRLNANEERI